MNITDQQQRVLEALSCFTYLTAKQMVALTLSKNIDSLRAKSLARLERHKKQFIKSLDFGWIPQRGRLAKIYYLTANGAALLADVPHINLDDIHYPKGGVQFSSDYIHRVNFIDFHIAFRHWLKQQEHALDFFYSYFDKIAANGRETSALPRKPA